MKSGGDGGGDDDWMTTYADMVTLLMAFFVLLVSISKVDIVLFEQVKSGMEKSMGSADPSMPINTLKQDLQAMIQAEQVQDEIKLGETNEGLRLSIETLQFFDAGSAELQPFGKEVLAQTTSMLLSGKYVHFSVTIEGHTDDQQPYDRRYPSNWELSTARAATIARFFEEAGMRRERITAVGFADTRPLVPNRDFEGFPLPLNQKINRRVDIRISPLRYQ